MSEPDLPYRPGPQPKGIGYRFRRPLTPAELDAIMAAARASRQKRWTGRSLPGDVDILLGEAEGMTMAEASERGLRFHPTEYAIPESQADVLLAIWRRHRGPHYLKDSVVGMLWINMGPGTYPDEPPTAHREHPDSRR